MILYNITAKFDDVVNMINNDINIKLNDVADDLATTNSNIAELTTELEETNTNVTTLNNAAVKQLSSN